VVVPAFMRLKTPIVLFAAYVAKTTTSVLGRVSAMGLLLSPNREMSKAQLTPSIYCRIEAFDDEGLMQQCFELITAGIVHCQLQHLLEPSQPHIAC
jgi:hypothetical protein